MPLRRCTRTIACAFALATAFAAGPTAIAAPGTDTEEEPVLDAAGLVRPALLSGPGFSVDPHVELRGYMAHFTLDTALGPLQAESVEILAEREAELAAVEALDRVTHSAAFLHAAGNRIGSTAKALAQVVLHPVGSVLGIPAGVARYFRHRADALAARAQDVSDRAARQFGTHGDAYPAADGPMTDARDEADASKPHRRWYERLAREAGREARRQLRYGAAKRAIAERLGLDPYTGNPHAQERLAALAWAGSGADFGIGTALDAIGGAGADVLAQGTRINEIVWKLSPADVRQRNEAHLLAHCSDALLVRQFLHRGAFTPTLQTALADALDALDPQGCNALLELGMTAASDLEARFLVNALRLVVAHRDAHANGGTLLTVGAGLAYVAPDGALVLPLPVDRLSWTDEVRTFLDRPELRSANRTVLIGGDASLRARRNLATRGWSVVLRAPRAGAPPYLQDEPAPVDTEG